MLYYYLVHKKGTTVAYLADSAYNYLFFWPLGHIGGNEFNYQSFHKMVLGKD